MDVYPRKVRVKQKVIVLLCHSQVHLEAERVVRANHGLILTRCRRVVLKEGRVDEAVSPKKIWPTFEVGWHNLDQAALSKLPVSP